MSIEEDISEAEKNTMIKISSSKMKGPLVRPITHLSVVLGITFCVIGGAIMSSSLVLSWSILPSQQLSLWDMIAKGGFTSLAFLIPMSGALCAILSCLDILAEKGWRRFKGPSALGSLISASFGVVAIVLVVWEVNQDMERGIATAFGPALFMSVFGGVLSLAGGTILTIDYLEALARRGKFVATGGSSYLRGVLQPTMKTVKSESRETKEKAVSWEKSSNVTLPNTGLECPNCYSPVQPQWRICPICGQELIDS
ncbi:MAG: zinc ribbon domain-containing protein [Methanomassiliicoccales archaeon]